MRLSITRGNSPRHRGGLLALAIGLGLALAVLSPQRVSAAADGASGQTQSPAGTASSTQFLAVALCLATGLVLLLSWRAIKAKCDALEKEVDDRERKRQKEAQPEVADGTPGRTLTAALDAAEEEMQGVEKLIDSQRATLFEQMSELAVDHQAVVLEDYAARYEQRLHEIERTYEALCVSRKAQYEKYCASLQDRCQYLSGALEDMGKDLGTRTAERDALQQHYGGSRTELDSVQRHRDSTLAELGDLMGALHPELYQGFRDLLAALPEKATLQPSTPAAAAAYFCLATPEFRLLFHLCLTLRSLRDRLPEADEATAVTLKLHLRELFHGLLDPQVAMFQSDPGILAGLREGLAPLLNEYVLQDYYRCRWPRRGEAYSQKQHQLNEIGGNVVRAIHSATLIDAQTGEVVFKAVVDTED